MSLQNFYEKPAFDYPLNQMSVWLMLGNEGMERESNNSFCAPTPSAMVFGRSDGDRVAVTRDLALRPGYTLQFKVGVNYTVEDENVCWVNIYGVISATQYSIFRYILLIL